MRLSYLLILIFSTPLLANIQCNKNEKFLVDLKNDTSGSLQNFKTQDQDSLGVCYANSLSVMLESWTGKPVSYHQLAVAHGLDQFFVRKSQNSAGEFFSEGGESCDAFNALKKKDKKLCQKKDVLFENLLDSSDQELYLKQIGKFYDELQSIPSIEEEKILSVIKSSTESAKKLRVEECQDLVELEKQADEGLNELVKILHQNFTSHYQIYLNLKEKMSFSKENVQRFEDFKTQSEKLGHYIGDKDEDNFVLSPEVEKRLAELLFDLKRNTYPLKDLKEKKKFIFDLIKTVLGEDSIYKNDEIELQSLSNYLANQDDLKDSVLSPVLSYSSPDFCLSKAHQQLFLSALNENSECLQQMPQNISDLLGDVDKILSSNFDDLNYNDKFFDLLGNPSEGMDPFFMGLINNSCEKDGIDIPGDAECHYVRLPERLGSMDKIFKSFDERKKLEKEKTISTLNSLVSGQLLSEIKGSDLKGRALVVDVCSGFMKQSKVSYNWPKTDDEVNCNYYGKHSFHSMAIIGMRCQEGKIQYKIQNSWGASCSGSYSKEVRDLCDPKDGSFWVDESTLADNVTGISLMSRKKAHYGESF